jgi:hypothetical protein
VLIVQGDQQGRRKMDAKLVGQAIGAAVEVSLPMPFSDVYPSGRRVARRCEHHSALR